jgi:hypothetical protein
MKKYLVALLAMVVSASVACAGNFSGFQVNSAGGSSCSNTTLASIPAGTFTPATQNNGSVVTNADSTPGWTATNYSVIQSSFTAPLDCVYNFTVTAFQTANPGIANQNMVSVYVDGLALSYSGATAANFYVQQVTNTSPAQPFVFSIAVRAGIHLVVIAFNQPQTAALVSAAQGVHVDRLIIAETSTVAPAEPAGSVDPFQYPDSAFHFYEGRHWLWGDVEQRQRS